MFIKNEHIKIYFIVCLFYQKMSFFYQDEIGTYGSPLISHCRQTIGPALIHALQRSKGKLVFQKYSHVGKNLIAQISLAI